MNFQIFEVDQNGLKESLGIWILLKISFWEFLDSRKIMKDPTLILDRFCPYYFFLFHVDSYTEQSSGNERIENLCNISLHKFKSSTSDDSYSIILNN